MEFDVEGFDVFERFILNFVFSLVKASSWSLPWVCPSLGLVDAGFEASRQQGVDLIIDQTI